MKATMRWCAGHVALALLDMCARGAAVAVRLQRYSRATPRAIEAPNPTGRRRGRHRRRRRLLPGGFASGPRTATS